VPPPPVGGAAVGIGLGDGLRVADDAGRLADGLDDGLFVGPCEDVDGLACGLVLAVGVPIPDLPLAEAVGVGEPAAPGENVAGVEGGEDPEQAASESTVKVAKPAAVNLALNPLRAKVPNGLFITGISAYANGSPVGRRRAGAHHVGIPADVPRGIVFRKNRGKGDRIESVQLCRRCHFRRLAHTA
jgi:hypothetical protein